MVKELDKVKDSAFENFNCSASSKSPSHHQLKKLLLDELTCINSTPHLDCTQYELKSLIYKNQYESAFDQLSSGQPEPNFRKPVIIKDLYDQMVREPKVNGDPRTVVIDGKSKDECKDDNEKKKWDEKQWN